MASHDDHHDVHHHRCNPDGISVEDATRFCLDTWNRKPHFHISSSRDEGHQRSHSQFISEGDWPKCWNELDIVVDVEAKAKEEAVLKLQKFLDSSDLTCCPKDPEKEKDWLEKINQLVP